MIAIKLTVEDLARTRFAISPMAVTTLSYRTLLFPELYPRHRGWASQAVTQMNGSHLKALSIVHPRGRRMPDFLTPLPSGPTETVEGEIRSLMAVPAGKSSKVRTLAGDCAATTPPPNNNPNKQTHPIILR